MNKLIELLIIALACPLILPIVIEGEEGVPVEKEVEESGEF